MTSRLFFFIHLFPSPLSPPFSQPCKEITHKLPPPQKNSLPLNKRNRLHRYLSLFFLGTRKMQASKALRKTIVLTNFHGTLSKYGTILVERLGTQLYYLVSTENPKHNVNSQTVRLEIRLNRKNNRKVTCTKKKILYFLIFCRL